MPDRAPESEDPEAPVEQPALGELVSMGSPVQAGTTLPTVFPLGVGDPPVYSPFTVNPHLRVPREYPFTVSRAHPCGPRLPEPPILQGPSPEGGSGLRCPTSALRLWYEGVPKTYGSD